MSAWNDYIKDTPIPFLVQLAYIQLEGGMNIYMIGEKHVDRNFMDINGEIKEFVNILCAYAKRSDTIVHVERFEDIAKKTFKGEGVKSYMYGLMHKCRGNIDLLLSRGDFIEGEFDNDRKKINDFYVSLLSTHSFDKTYSRNVLEKHITEQLVDYFFLWSREKIITYMTKRGSIIIKILAANFADIDRALAKINFNDFESTVTYAPIIEIGFIVFLDFKRSMKTEQYKNHIIVTGDKHTCNLIKCFELLHRKNLIKISFIKNVSTYEEKADGSGHYKYPNTTFGDLKKFLAASADI